MKKHKYLKDVFALFVIAVIAGVLVRMYLYSRMSGCRAMQNMGMDIGCAIYPFIPTVAFISSILFATGLVFYALVLLLKKRKK